MVLKLPMRQAQETKPFESSVILNGTQTNGKRRMLTDGFESSVILNGTQTSVFPEP